MQWRKMWTKPKRLFFRVARLAVRIASVCVSGSKTTQATYRRGTNVKTVMGVIFLEHIGGTRLFSCASCDTNLTNRDQLISTRFTGATGRAFLFNKVVNLKYRYASCFCNTFSAYLSCYLISPSHLFYIYRSPCSFQTFFSQKALHSNHFSRCKGCCLQNHSKIFNSSYMIQFCDLNLLHMVYI